MSSDKTSKISYSGLLFGVTLLLICALGISSLIMASRISPAYSIGGEGSAGRLLSFYALAAVTVTIALMLLLGIHKLLRRRTVAFVVISAAAYILPAAVRAMSTRDFVPLYIFCVCSSLVGLPLALSTLRDAAKKFIKKVPFAVLLSGYILYAAAVVAVCVITLNRNLVFGYYSVCALIIISIFFGLAFALEENTGKPHFIIFVISYLLLALYSLLWTVVRSAGYYIFFIPSALLSLVAAVMLIVNKVRSR